MPANRTPRRKAKPAEPKSYPPNPHLPYGQPPRRWHVWPKPYGTEVLVTVDPFSTCEPAMEFGRTVHFEYKGGHASSETGYRSNFIRFKCDPELTADHLTTYAIDACESFYVPPPPGVQLNLFN